jgi:hypothetical protein
MMMLCAARQLNNAAGFRTVTQDLHDRGQITSGSSVFSAGKSWQNLGVMYPAWCRDTVSGYSRGYTTKDQPDGADDVIGADKSTTSSGDIGEEMRVDTWVRDELEEPEGGPEPGVKEKAKQAMSSIGEKIKDAGKAITGSTDNETVEKVGETVKGAGDTVKEKGSNKTSLGKEDVVTS